MLMVVVVVVIVLVLMVVLVIVVAVVACWWYGCHVAHNNMAPAFGVKGRKEGECNDSPAYVDSDNGKHCHHLDNMQCCHVITFHCG